jgi:hypothetical protein
MPMTLPGHVFTVPDGVRGFDANQPITATAAAAFHAHGYRFCARYVRRATAHDYDLTTHEAITLLEARLGLMVVQHVAPEGWLPTPHLGTTYGAVAASEARAIGVSAGVTLWCDLEGVAAGAIARDVIDYCNRWHSEVAGAGFVPGLYVGSGAGLNRLQLYRDLRFTHYWGAYNLNAAEVPAVRDLQMKQAVPRAADKVPGVSFPFLVDSVSADALGGHPTLLAMAGWPE